MVSINTSNTGVAMAALRRVNAELNVTQNRIATGYKVNSAADNATVWSTVSKMRSDNGTNDAIKGGIATAKARADAANAALDTVSGLLQQIKDISIAAAASTADGSASEIPQITALQTQITKVIAGAKIDGVNLLASDAAQSVTVSMSEGTAVSLSVTGADVFRAYAAGPPIVTAGAMVAPTTAPTSDSDVAAMSGIVDAAQTEIAKLSAKFGSFSKGLDAAVGFLDKLSDIRDSAISGLVDADLEKESAKLSALQVKQQLAYQAISMTNGSAQNILRLFQ